MKPFDEPFVAIDAPRPRGSAFMRTSMKRRSRS